MKLYKKDIAIELINTAVKLYFEDKSPYALHTILMSSKVMLEELSKKLGLPTILTSIKEESHKSVIKDFHKIYNFAKHSDKDLDIYIEVKENINELNEIFLLYVIGLLYTQIYKEYTIHMKIFFAYIITQGIHNELLINIDKSKITELLDKASELGFSKGPHLKSDYYNFIITEYERTEMTNIL